MALTYVLLALLTPQGTAQGWAGDASSLLQTRAQAEAQAQRESSDTVTVGRDTDWARRLRVDLRAGEARLQQALTSTPTDFCVEGTCITREGLGQVGYDLLIAAKRNKKLFQRFQEKAAHQLKTALNLDARRSTLAVSGKRLFVKEGLVEPLRATALALANATQLASALGEAGTDHARLGTAVGLSLGRGIGMELGLDFRFSLLGKGTKMCSYLSALKDLDDGPLSLGKEPSQLPLYFGVGAGFPDAGGPGAEVVSTPEPQQKGFALRAGLAPEAGAVQDLEVGLCYSAARQAYGHCGGRESRRGSRSTTWCTAAF